MNRREFITTAGLVSATTFISACGLGGGDSDEMEQTQPKPEGPVTLYYEFKIAGPAIQSMTTEVSNQANALENKTGFLSLSLKQMVGESTMVKNYPTDLKGALKSAVIDGAHQGIRPFVYALMIRFDSYDNLIASQSKEWFKNNIEPLLYAYKPGNPPQKTPIALDYYQGIYKTVAAGDANNIYKTKEEIISFLKNQKDIADTTYRPIPADGSSNGVTITVLNHVTIRDEDTEIVNQKATALLTTAQETYQPSSNPDDGNPGTLNNTFYQKPLTTEIMQNAYSAGGTRNYLFHGVWKSVGDHENSHIDPRFRKAAMPVGAYVIAGPVEPFYQTMILHNSNS